MPTAIRFIARFTPPARLSLRKRLRLGDEPALFAVFRSLCLAMTTLGLIVGNRGFFPAHLCESGRRDILRILEEEKIKTVALPVEASKFGAVESLEDARRCADLLKSKREEIDGILVTLPNFGDERAVANT